MTSRHSHLQASTAKPHAPRGARTALAVLAVALLAATVLGLVRMWPTGDGVERTSLLAPGVELLDARVLSVPDEASPTAASRIDAEGASPRIRGEAVSVDVPPDVAGGLHEGDRIRILSVDDLSGAASGGGTLADADGAGGADADGADDGAAPDADALNEDPEGSSQYTYFDHQRTLPLTIMFLGYLLIVAVVARGRGLRAVIGLACGIAVVVWFLLPGLLDGENAVLLALVASGAMIFPSVYIAHGISVRSTTALIGTFLGVGVTVLVAVLTGRWAGMTGADSETTQLLYATDPRVSLSAVFLAGVLISGLGALNDVTITQASAAWELREAMPDASRWNVFSSAMRIGRDHIASTVYTLAYAYIGSALPVLLLASTIDRGLLDTLGAGEIASEVFRTLVASAGLVLAIPVTTALATALAGGSRTPEDPRPW
jgi:uncharacterized membrane protein